MSPFGRRGVWEGEMHSSPGICLGIGRGVLEEVVMT